MTMVKGISVVNLDGDDTRQKAYTIALSMYTDEPCRICRRLLTWDDLHDGAKFASYSVDGTARAAHRVCWENFVELLRTLPVERIHELMNSKPDVDASVSSEASE